LQQKDLNMNLLLAQTPPQIQKVMSRLVRRLGRVVLIFADLVLSKFKNAVILYHKPRINLEM
jgi:hypothetical protein